MTLLSETVLFERCRRRLAQEGLHLKRCSERSDWFLDLGRYHVHDERKNLIMTHVDLEQMGRDLEVLERQTCRRVPPAMAQLNRRRISRPRPPRSSIVVEVVR